MTSPVISPLAGQAEISAITNLLNIIRAQQQNPDGNAPAGSPSAPASGLDAGRGMGNFGGFVGGMIGGPIGGMVGRVGGSALGAGIAAQRAGEIADMFGLTGLTDPTSAAARGAAPAAVGALAGLTGIPGLGMAASRGLASVMGVPDARAELTNAFESMYGAVPGMMGGMLRAAFNAAQNAAPSDTAFGMDEDFGPNTPSFGMANHAEYGGSFGAPGESATGADPGGPGTDSSDGHGSSDNFASGGLIGLPNQYAKGGVARVRDERAVDWMANDGDRARRRSRQATGVVINPENDVDGPFYYRSGEPPPDIELNYPDEHFDMDPNEEFEGVRYSQRVREYATGGKIVRGPGTGLDDLVPTTIDGRRAAALSDGEFVIPADVVSMMGDGSTDAGSRRLYDLIKGVRQNKTGTNEQAGPLPIGNILQRVLR